MRPLSLKMASRSIATVRRPNTPSAIRTMTGCFIGFASLSFCDPLSPVFQELVQIRLGCGLGVVADYRFRSGGPHQGPTAVAEQKLQSINAILLDNAATMKLVNIRCDLLFNPCADRRIELHVQSSIIYCAYFRKKII